MAARNVTLTLAYPTDEYVVGDRTYRQGEPIPMGITEAQQQQADAATQGVILTLDDPRAESSDDTTETGS